MFRFYIPIKFKIFLGVPFWKKYFSGNVRKNIEEYIRGYERRSNKIDSEFLKKLFLDLSKSKIRFNFNLEEFLKKKNLNLNYSLRQFLSSRLLVPDNYSFKKV